MFEYYNNILCVQGRWLDQAGVITLLNLKLLTHRGKIKRAKMGKGLGNTALYVYDTLPERYKNIIEREMGINPREQGERIPLAQYIQYHNVAAAFFSSYELEDGRYLGDANEQAVEEYTANASVFLGVEKVIEKVMDANVKVNKADLWKNISEAVQNLNHDIRTQYPFSLPSNPQALRAKYEACMMDKSSNRYPRVGLEGLIHNNYCNNHSEKITTEIGEWLITFYALPNKPSIPELLMNYEKNREVTGWPHLSETSAQNFLMKPENERIWLRGRDGIDAYTNRFGHTIKRDRDSMFPNAHWAIDGTKFDAVHYRAEGNKMASEMNIDVIIDVHSEKIIGWSFSESETHVDHFKALKMAVNETCTRPYLLTYDAQSGHRTKKMQELYTKVVSTGGTHYHHKVGRKSNPIEQVFNRFQQQVVGKRWFSDKQSIKSKQSRSQVNVDFLREFKKALPTKEELYQHWIIMVDEWNSMKHPRYNKTRSEVYMAPCNFTRELGTLEQLSMFWLNESKPKKYYAHGMPLTVAGKDYHFEVYDENGDIDIEFRRKYVNTKVVVSYDPDMLNEFIALYEVDEKGNRSFISYAQKKREHAQVPFLLSVSDNEKLRKDIAVRDAENLRDWEAYQRMTERTGVTREKLIDEQNASISGDYEFQSKLNAYSTKEEQQKNNKKSVFAKLNNN